MLMKHVDLTPNLNNYELSNQQPTKIKRCNF